MGINSTSAVKQCPICGAFAVVKPKPESGDSLFIGTFDSKTRTIYGDNGIVCNFTLCQNCGNIQLQAKPN